MQILTSSPALYRRSNLAIVVLEGPYTRTADFLPILINIRKQFVLINRRKKIESGQRTTSFSYLLNDKRGAIGRALASVPMQYREVSFMFGQLRAYTSHIPFGSIDR